MVGKIKAWNKIIECGQDITWVRFFRTRRDHAVVRDLVVEGEGEGRRVVLVDGHGRVVGEVGLVHHLEHVVAANLPRKKWREI